MRKEILQKAKEIAEHKEKKAKEIHHFLFISPSDCEEVIKSVFMDELIGDISQYSIIRRQIVGGGFKKGIRKFMKRVEDEWIVDITDYPFVDEEDDDDDLVTENKFMYSELFEYMACSIGMVKRGTVEEVVYYIDDVEIRMSELINSFPDHDELFSESQKMFAEIIEKI